jgi:hypothetical protein
MILMKVMLSALCCLRITIVPGLVEPIAVTINDNAFVALTCSEDVRCVA